MSIPSSQTAEVPSSVRAGTVADEVDGVRAKNLGKRDVEMVRLIGQYLCDKGYNRAYNELAEDTGIVLEHQSATDLRNAILEGRWNDTEVAVNALAESIGNASVLQHIRFLLLEQQYLELLEEDDPVSALKLLRSCITPLKPDSKRLYNLTECLMCRSSEDLYRQAGGWDGKAGHSRAHLVESIQRFMPAQTMLPPSRLETIVAESVRSQLSNCLFHLEPISWNSPLDSISILQPHGCSIMDFPVFPVQKIEHRDTELYFSVFSPDGNYLAIGGKESNVDLFKVDKERNTISHSRTLSVEASINHICWSPDSKKIAVCCGSRPGPIVVFDVATRRKICQKHEKADDVYITATFFGDNRKLAFGGLKGGCFYIIDTEDDGRVLFSHDHCRVQCMVAIVPPPSSFGFPIPTPMDMDPSASRGPTTANSNTSTSTPSFDHPGLVHTLDQLLIVDHMYRVRLFRFGYTLPAANSGDAGAAATNVTGMEQIAADATSAAAMTTGMWTTATAAASQGGTGGVTPIIMALQTALFPHQQQHHRAQLRAGSGGLPPPPIHQSTSDSSFGMGVGFGSSRLQTPAAIPAASASTSGSLVGMLWACLPGQVLVQIQPNPGFTPHPLIQSGSNVPGSVPNLMAAQIGAPGYSLESLSTFPTLVSSLPVLMHQYYMRYAGMPSSTAGPRASSSAGVPGTSSIRAGAPLASSMMTGLGEGGTGGADSDTAEVSTNTEVSNVGTTQTPPGGPPSPATQGQGYSLIQQVTLIKEIYPIQSIVLSPSCKRLLVALNGKGLVLWDLEAQGIIQRFCGHQQVSQKLCYSFCGANEDFICCGSENGMVHIWRVGTTRNCRPIHSMMSASSNEIPVTGVHWNPTHPHMIASVNDEGDIHIWAPASK
ncbi:unnamed protein product [Hymenolepis diminuta]|uniref:WD domain-containing protein n=1 Tax=Hymenolepis diminuta TaxID=6216 RepID=A0A158QBP2_HYMDI|nr:unnamed protein product [Hymenolepis diminuta]